MTKEQEYRNEKRKILKIYLVADLLMLVGGIMNAQDRFNVNLHLAGGLVGGVGAIVFFIAMMKRWRSSYRELEDEFGSNNSSFSEVIGDFGVGMVIGALIVSLGLIACGVIFLWYLANFNWFKAFLFLLAFQLITDLRDFFAVKDEEE